MPKNSDSILDLQLSFTELPNRFQNHDTATDWPPISQPNSISDIDLLDQALSSSYLPISEPSSIPVDVKDRQLANCFGNTQSTDDIEGIMPRQTVVYIMSLFFEYVCPANSLRGDRME